MKKFRNVIFLAFVMLTTNQTASVASACNVGNDGSCCIASSSFTNITGGKFVSDDPNGQYSKGDIFASADYEVENRCSRAITIHYNTCRFVKNNYRSSLTIRPGQNRIRFDVIRPDCDMQITEVINGRAQEPQVIPRNSGSHGQQGSATGQQNSVLAPPTRVIENSVPDAGAQQQACIKRQSSNNDECEGAPIDASTQSSLKRISQYRSLLSEISASCKLINENTTVANCSNNADERSKAVQRLQSLRQHLGWLLEKHEKVKAAWAAGDDKYLKSVGFPPNFDVNRATSDVPSASIDARQPRSGQPTTPDKAVSSQSTNRSSMQAVVGIPASGRCGDRSFSNGSGKLVFDFGSSRNVYDVSDVQWSEYKKLPNGRHFIIVRFKQGSPTYRREREVQFWCF